jgi:dihydroorotate dehydrogenase (NAD+) catalytic subunit
VAPIPLSTTLGSMTLSSPLIAASGTVGSVWEWAEIADVSSYGAAVAKSVSPSPWPGRTAPRLAPLSTGMLNGIGIQNPGIESWREMNEKRLKSLRIPVWGSCVGEDVDGFVMVSRGLEDAGVVAVEVNLSCPNLEDGLMFSFEPEASSTVIDAVKRSVAIPVGAKLSPNTPDIVNVAAACKEAGADFVVLTNTAYGFGISLAERRPLLSGGVGGYSGPGLKPLSLRCVYEVARALPDLPIVGCGGVTTGADVAEYLMAGASAVQIGTLHLSEPKAGRRIHRELVSVIEHLGVDTITNLIGSLA